MQLKAWNRQLFQVALGGHFNKLFEWRFDQKRVSRKSSTTKNRKDKQIKEMIKDHVLDHELELSDNFEFLNLFYPCFEIHIPRSVRDFYNLLTSIVTLEGGGMGGVGFRETKAGVAKVLKNNGYCSVTMGVFVDMYENKLMNEYQESIKED